LTRDWSDDIFDLSLNLIKIHNMADIEEKVNIDVEGIVTVEEDAIDNKLIAEMTESGVLHTHKKSKADPRMRRFIAANRHEIDILDARAVLNSLNKAAEFLKGILAKDNGTVLFVGTTPPAKEMIKELAEKLEQPYVVTRWIGGTITNFDVIRKRIDYYEELKIKKESGELDKYTKKEQVGFSKEIEKLSGKFGGLTRLTRLPDVVFVVDAKEHSTAVREARHKEIPLVVVVDSDDNPDVINYPIIASDHSRSGIRWVLERIKEKIEGKQ